VSGGGLPLFQSERSGPGVRDCVWAAGEVACRLRPGLRGEIVDGADEAGLYAEIEACLRRQPAAFRRTPVDYQELARRYLAERDTRPDPEEDPDG